MSQKSPNGYIRAKDLNYREDWDKPAAPSKPEVPIAVKALDYHAKKESQPKSHLTARPGTKKGRWLIAILVGVLAIGSILIAKIWLNHPTPRVPADHYVEKTQDFYYALVLLQSDFDAEVDLDTIRAHIAAANVAHEKWSNSLVVDEIMHPSRTSFTASLGEFERAVQFKQWALEAQADLNVARYPSTIEEAGKRRREYKAQMYDAIHAARDDLGKSKRMMDAGN